MNGRRTDVYIMDCTAASTRRLGLIRFSSRRSVRCLAGRSDGSLSVMRPKIFHQPSPFHRSILDRCSRLNSDYVRPYLLFNGHVETIWAGKCRTLLNLDLERELMEMPDGGLVAIDTLKTDEPLSPDQPLLILLPGLAGGSQCTYVQYAIRSAHASGFRTIVFNGRGMASSPLRTPQFYSASYTEDLRNVIDRLHDRYPKTQLFAMGWSLGANILVNYLGEEGKDSKISAAVSLCNPFDLSQCDTNWQSGFSQIYNWNLASAMKDNFRSHMHLFEGYDVERAMSASTVREVDDAITCVTFGWESVDAYYRGSGSIHRISDVGIPLLCIQADDDPICPIGCIPIEKIKQNENCVLVITPRGGHLGWVTAEDGWFGPPWSDKAALEWLNAVIEHPSPLVKIDGDVDEAHETVSDGGKRENGGILCASLLHM